MNIPPKYFYLIKRERQIKNLENFAEIKGFGDSLIEDIDVELKNCSLEDKIIIDQLKQRIENFCFHDDTLKSHYDQTVYCSICSRRYKKVYFVDHVLKEHKNELSLIIGLELTMANLPINQTQQKKLDAIENRDKNKLNKLLDDIFYKPLEGIQNELNQLEKLEYHDIDKMLCIDEQFEKIRAFSLIDVKGEIEKCQEKIDLVKNQLIVKPERKEFIRLFCKVLYATWDNISFMDGGIYIFIDQRRIPVKLNNVRSTLNKVKKEFFKRNFGHEKYRLVFKDSKFRPDLSSGIDRLNFLLFNNLKSQRISVGSDSLFRLVTPDMTKSRILAQIQSEWNTNEYLRNCALILSPDDKVLAIQEYNNEVLEECIMFTVSRALNNFIIVENIHEGRATYIFYNQSVSLDGFISLIKDYFSSNMPGRREQLTNSSSVIINNYRVKYHKILHLHPKDHLFQLRAILQ